VIRAAAIQLAGISDTPSTVAEPQLQITGALGQPSARDSRADAPVKKSFRATQFEAREGAILDSTHRLLSAKGYELMSMDDIASEVGIAKGSLYKHFASKEALAAAVMLRLLRRTSEALDALPETVSASDRLRALLEWVLRERLAGSVPHLPSTSAPLRESLTRNRDYVDLLIMVSERIGGLIREAQSEGSISSAYREEFLLYHLYARSCDPTLDYLREGGALSDDEIVAQMVTATFEGLNP
jgi:TetR/AcrR family transcriptional regulator of autoinduction and epiphytic fitness